MSIFYESRSENLFIGSMTSYPFPLHVHEIVELACVLQGEVAMQIDGQAYVLRPGDIAVVFPLIPHSFDRLSPDSRGLAAFFLADTIPQFTNTFLNALPETPVLRSACVNADTRLAVERLMNDPDGEASPIRLAYLHLLLASTLSKMPLRPISSYNEQGLAYRVFKYIFDHACEDITLENTARGLGISHSHLSHLFSQRFHINFRRLHDPNVHLLQLRLWKHPHLPPRLRAGDRYAARRIPAKAARKGPKPFHPHRRSYG